jgi:FkbM family methyltransferase
MTLLSDDTKKEIKRAANFGGFLSLANQVEYWWGNRITSDHLSLYRPFISDHSVCFDIGAHYGRKTKLFRKLGARVVAVEPIADCCRKLRELYANDPKITIIERACGPSAGRATLRYCRLNPQNSAIAGSSREEPNAEDCNVLMTTLDALIEVYGVPTFCKIDCEGYENAVLSGLSSRVPSISFEFHSADLAAVESCTGRLIQLGNDRFNFTRASMHRFVTPAWLTSAELLRRLAAEPPEIAGDIFALNEELSFVSRI